ncbi:hypothetical protein ACFYM5_21605 [Streptomyces sp. NPDC006706]|uniref:hypothetical protein n=1 Tax=Streptomyces sp. NPDC006706 TaxID=3364761 RepID=UPI00369E362E
MEGEPAKTGHVVSSFSLSGDRPNTLIGGMWGRQTDSGRAHTTDSPREARRSSGFAEDVPVQVLAEAGRQRFPHLQAEGTPAVRPALGTREHRALLRRPLVQAVGEAEQVGDQQNLDARVQEGTGDRRPISEPSRSLVAAKDSLNSTIAPGVTSDAMSFILASSSSSLPLSISVSSSRR